MNNILDLFHEIEIDDTDLHHNGYEWPIDCGNKSYPDGYIYIPIHLNSTDVVKNAWRLIMFSLRNCKQSKLPLVRPNTIIPINEHISVGVNKEDQACVYIKSGDRYGLAVVNPDKVWLI